METVATFTKLDTAEGFEDCQVIGVHGHRMQVKLSKWVESGSAVKVEADNTIALGEVSYCHPEGEGYVVWVELLQTLHDVAEMSRLARALLS